MKFTIKQVAEVLQGHVEGDDTIEVGQLSKIEEGVSGSLSFLSNDKYESFIYDTNASAVIVNKSFTATKPLTTTLIRVENAYESFTQLLEFYQQAKLSTKQGLEQPSSIASDTSYGGSFYLGAFAYVGSNCKIGENVKIFPQTFIGDNVVIGNDVVIHAGSKIMSDCILGNRVTIHAGTVIGADGFGFVPLQDGSYKKVPQTGNVIIEDDVEIGALTTIDRATLGSTIIRSGAKLDNQIQIAHNVEIGSHTVIAAQTGIAGSTKIGKYTKIGGQVGIAGHLQIGDHVGVQAQSGIGRNVKDKEALQGSPAFNYAEWSRSYIHFKNLTKIEQRLSVLEKSNL